jgi:deuterolysin
LYYLKLNLTLSIATKKSVPFGGILARYNLANLTSDAFVAVPAGKSYTTTLDLASLHDLSTGGDYTVLSEGAVPYFEGTAKTTADYFTSKALTFKSNTLAIAVDGVAAAKVKRVITPLSKLERRVTLDSGCSGSSETSTINALANAVSLADAAAAEAASGDEAKFEEYFKTTDADVRNTVAERLQAVSSAASSTTSGEVTYYCSDVYNCK